MPDPRTIAIFAQSPAVKAYLADIAGLGGYDIVSYEAEASVLLAVSPLKDRPSVMKEQSVIVLGASPFPSEGENICVLDMPCRAARLIDVLRRRLREREALPAQISIGPCRLDRQDNLWIFPTGTSVRLTEKETAIMLCLSEAERETVSKQALLENVWAYAEGVETHTLETHIYRLRQKIEKNASSPEILLTAEDGYRLSL